MNKFMDGITDKKDINVIISNSLLKIRNSSKLKKLNELIIGTLSSDKSRTIIDTTSLVTIVGVFSIATADFSLIQPYIESLNLNISNEQELYKILTPILFTATVLHKSTRDTLIDFFKHGENNTSDTLSQCLSELNKELVDCDFDLKKLEDLDENQLLFMLQSIKGKNKNEIKEKLTNVMKIIENINSENLPVNKFM